MRNVQITSLQGVERVWLGEGGHGGDAAQPGLNVTSPVFPHAAIICSFGEAQVIVGDSRGSTGIRAGPVVRRGGRVEARFYTLLKMRRVSLCLRS